jgi:hypothetical protein
MVKTKILIISANPWDTKRIGVAEEYKKIKEVLQLSKLRDNFILDNLPAASDAELRQALLDFEPDILHFSGHGELDGLCFQQANGDTQFITQDSLSRLFSLFSKKIKCVVLNACYSAEQANTIAQHIDTVIGMSQAIGDEAAIRFSEGFYQALFSGREIEFAFNFGRNMIGIPEWEIPQLIKKQSINISAIEPFLNDYKTDILIHVAEIDKQWAKGFEFQLEKYLTQLSCRIHIYDENNDTLHKVGIVLLIVSKETINNHQSNLVEYYESSNTSLFLIIRSNISSDNLPKKLASLTPYNFSENLDYLDSSELQILSERITEQLSYLKNKEKLPKDAFIFIHTKQDEIELAQPIKELFVKNGLRCVTPNKKDYKDDIKLNQDNCFGILIFYSQDFIWTKRMIIDYFNFKKRNDSKKSNKKPLKIVRTYVDCSKPETEENIDDLNLYPDDIAILHIFPNPPKSNIDSLINCFKGALK